ncbi:NAD(P)H-binding protein [Polaromonas sp.]|nr:NAD(P)H-binding protein [Candidatus Saccharibacteria bacterium]
MQITIFGASGKVGQQVAAKLLAENHTLVVLVHRSNPYANTSGVTTVSGSVTDGTAVAKAIEGSAAVISTLGSWGSPNKDVVSSGTELIITAMKARGVTRLITITGASAFYGQDKPTMPDKITRRLLKLVAPKILRDGEQHLALLEASDLNWTCLRSPVMTAAKQDAYRFQTKLPPLWAWVPRQAVAQAIVDQITATDNLGKAPVICHV